ncbi:D-glycero-beta-D-manno-heptose 1,7-bisphosphate 7-phosphatase [Candidatus Njordibacter sp. Uisw_039]|uniref:D-glycero-alpha-D-manno-heptose-1,7-bisphosphate 7-phosphatase n=1 Tax=Candidatus Njordibacter sp. Uisw_039 TaxID=3230972 RepID=UPI003D3B46F6
MNSKIGNYELINSTTPTNTPTGVRALFLDRDGVINIDHGYVHQIDNFEFVDGIFDVVQSACANNFKIVVVTNQAGIGRGLYSERQFHQLTSWMCRKFTKAGAPIDKVYFSPFHPTEGLGEYKKDDFSRKPNPGMILQAEKELCLDLDKSILIGDRSSDIQAGIAAGLGLNIFFAQGSLAEVIPQQCHVITSLLGALPFINSHTKSLELR